MTGIDEGLVDVIEGALLDAQGPDATTESMARAVAAALASSSRLAPSDDERDALIGSLLPASDGSFPPAGVIMLTVRDAKHYADRILAARRSPVPADTPSEDGFTRHQVDVALGFALRTLSDEDGVKFLEAWNAHLPGHVSLDPRPTPPEDVPTLLDEADLAHAMAAAINDERGTEPGWTLTPRGNERMVRICARVAAALAARTLPETEEPDPDDESVTIEMAYKDVCREYDGFRRDRVKEMTAVRVAVAKVADQTRRGNVATPPWVMEAVVKLHKLVLPMTPFPYREGQGPRPIPESEGSDRG